MPDQLIRPLRADHAADAYLGDEPPDLGPLRALTERAELGTLRPAYATAGGSASNQACFRFVRFVGTLAVWQR